MFHVEHRRTLSMTKPYYQQNFAKNIKYPEAEDIAQKYLSAELEAYLNETVEKAVKEWKSSNKDVSVKITTVIDSLLITSELPSKDIMKEIYTTLKRFDELTEVDADERINDLKSKMGKMFPNASGQDKEAKIFGSLCKSIIYLGAKIRLGKETFKTNKEKKARWETLLKQHTAEVSYALAQEIQLSSIQNEAGATALVQYLNEDEYLSQSIIQEAADLSRYIK